MAAGRKVAIKPSAHCSVPKRQHGIRVQAKTALGRPDNPGFFSVAAWHYGVIASARANQQRLKTGRLLVALGAPSGPLTAHWDAGDRMRFSRL
ncbi:hypothetical protein OPT61_g1501 [Boeremia exigua]|uniref:Uncharacterized protein n=1 Tax=Boeremia exigua TaxID=749465 RepID=A0ACC2IQ48_9PLEO|nr:hypothetical protein OPT61_g1501 [Boeremia exigua]